MLGLGRGRWAVSHKYTLIQKSLRTSQVAHQAGAYPGFCSMRRLEVIPQVSWPKHNAIPRLRLEPGPLDSEFPNGRGSRFAGRGFHVAYRGF